MDYILQQINEHKNKLKILINNLINTQNIYEEINFNNEIKKESEFILSLLTIKQNQLNSQVNQMNQGINMNFNPFNFNANMMAINQPNFESNIITVIFKQDWTMRLITVDCSLDEKISNIIEKYRKKSGDYDTRRVFLFNGKKLLSNMNASEAGFKHLMTVTVIWTQNLIA